MRRKNQPTTKSDPGKPTPLADKVDQLLTEARVIIPGAQALLGFQLSMTLMQSFQQWVAKKCGVAPSQSWDRIILFDSQDEADALRKDRSKLAHELDLVKYPQTVIREKRVLPRPEKATGRVPAVQNARQQHVLGSNDDRVALGMKVPFVVGRPSHKHVHADALAAVEAGALVEEFDAA